MNSQYVLGSHLPPSLTDTASYIGLGSLLAWIGKNLPRPPLLSDFPKMKKSWTLRPTRGLLHCMGNNYEG